LEKNSGLKAFNKARNILQCEEEDLPPGMRPKDVASLKYRPVASDDVERSFSMFTEGISKKKTWPKQLFQAIYFRRNMN